MFRDEFSIPELPIGIIMKFVLISPWDDPFFIGLNAIEIFTLKGTRAQVKSVSISVVTLLNHPKIQIESNAEQSFGELESLLSYKNCWPCTDLKGMWSCRYRFPNDDKPSIVPII